MVCLVVIVTIKGTDNIMKQFGLTEEELNIEVSDVHIDEISRRFCKLWRSLYSHLNLDETVCSDADRNNNTEVEKKIAFFKEWKQQKAYDATYKNLVYALVMINCNKDASAVCQMLAESLGKPMQVPVTSGTTHRISFRIVFDIIINNPPYTSRFLPPTFTSQNQLPLH